MSNRGNSRMYKEVCKIVDRDRELIPDIKMGPLVARIEKEIGEYVPKPMVRRALRDESVTWNKPKRKPKPVPKPVKELDVDAFTIASKAELSKLAEELGDLDRTVDLFNRATVSRVGYLMERIDKAEFAIRELQHAKDVLMKVEVDVREMQSASDNLDKRMTIADRRAMEMHEKISAIAKQIGTKPEQEVPARGILFRDENGQ